MNPKMTDIILMFVCLILCYTNAWAVLQIDKLKAMLHSNEFVDDVVRKYLDRPLVIDKSKLTKIEDWPPE